MKTKQVNYAYPFSDIAKKYNMPKGCWTVEIGIGSFMPWPKEIISAHQNEKEAINAAYIIDMPWSQCWLNCVNCRANFS